MFIAAALIALTAAAQGVMQLPNDESIVTGQLPNGLRYYLLHNDKPAQRAEFYLATDAGAFQETDDQDGLAHFLEHMCFNGTKNFPGKALLNYLQSIGAEFGRNINASTGFEETKYMLNNIPIVRESIIDSCLLIMHDYSHFVTCDPAEIDAERGVILEERRTRRNASWRSFEKSLPYYFAGTPYEKRTLIGSEEQLKTFKPESLVNFYKAWYQPDNQALVVVGDIDVKAVEEKIKTIFSDIPAPETPTVKPVHKPLLNEEPAVAIITDAEAQSSSIEILWKTEAFPKEMKNTNIGYTISLIQDIVSEVMSERFNDITADPASPFLSASFGFGGLCNECDVAMGNLSFKDGEAVPAFAAFMTEVEKMRRFGFTKAEVKRAVENITSFYEKKVEGASSRKNAEFINPILSNFYDNIPVLNPEMELQLVKAISSQISPEVIQQMIGELAKDFMADKYITIIYDGPEKEGLVNPDPEALKAIVKAVKEVEIQANAEETTNEPLVDVKKLKGSKVTKETEGIYGSTVWMLKNGLKVVVKPTDFKKDQVILNLYKDGGRALLTEEELYSYEDNVWQVFTALAGVSKFPQQVLSKMLAGKYASAYPVVGDIGNGIAGNCQPKDLETALQLMYLTFTDMRFDEQEYANAIGQIEAVLPNIMNNPQFALQVELQKTLYGNNPRIVPLSEESLAKVNLKTMEAAYKKMFNNVAGATLVIVGNVDLNTLKPLVEKYMGSLPKGKAAPVDKSVNPEIVKGEVINHFATPMQTPKSSVLQIYTAQIEESTARIASLEAAKFILDMIYTETLREDEGGTYGAGTYMSFERDMNRAVIQVQFDTNVESADKLNELAKKGLRKLVDEGATQAQVDMAKENMKKNIPENRINNNYWLGQIKNHERFGTDYDAEIEAAIEAVSVESIKAVVGEILAQDNYIEVIMHP